MSRKDSGEPVRDQGELDLGRVPVGCARISAMPGNGQDCEKAPEADSGLNTSAPFAHYDPATCWWKTSQVSLLTMHWDEYSETWPRAGTMRNGIVYRQVPLAPLTGGIGSGLWLTPSVEDAGREGSAENYRQYLENGRTTQARLRNQVMWPTTLANDPRHGLPSTAMHWRTPTEDDCANVNPKDTRRPGLVTQVKSIEGTGRLNPQWVEWLMGYPIGWTDCEDSATPSSRKSSKRSAK
jgi:hypothetical protein